MELTFSKPYEIVKREKYKTICVSKHPIWRKKMDCRRPAWHLARCSWSVGTEVNSCLNFEQSHDAVARLIKPENLHLTIRRGQSNLNIAFIFVSFEEKGYYSLVSVGQLSFDCHSYSEHSRFKADVKMRLLWPS